jgi:hypothetical protein
MESTKFVGLDVHKDAITIAVMNSAGKVIMESIIETKAVTIPAPDDRVNMKVLLHAGPRHGDAHAVEVGDREKEDQHPENAMAVFHRPVLAGWFILSQRSRCVPESVSRKAIRYARHIGQGVPLPACPTMHQGNYGRFSDDSPRTSSFASQNPFWTTNDTRPITRYLCRKDRQMWWRIALTRDCVSRMPRWLHFRGQKGKSRLNTPLQRCLSLIRPTPLAPPLPVRNQPITSPVVTPLCHLAVSERPAQSDLNP